MRHYYVIETTGGKVRDNNGLLEGNVIAFKQSKMRDEYIELRPRERQWVDAMAPEVRNAKKLGIVIHRDKLEPDKFTVIIPCTTYKEFTVNSYDKDEAINTVVSKLSGFGGFAYLQSATEGDLEQNHDEATAELFDTEELKAS